MKRYTALFLALLLALTLMSCSSSTAETESTEPAKPLLTCSIGYPVLGEDGRIVQTSGMKDYDAVTMKDALVEGIGKELEITFDQEGKIASIGGLKAENGNRFVIMSIASNGQPTIISDKPADITLEAYASYEIIYSDEDGNHIQILE